MVEILERQIFVAVGAGLAFRLHGEAGCVAVAAFEAAVLGAEFEAGLRVVEPFEVIRRVAVVAFRAFNAHGVFVGVAFHAWRSGMRPNESVAGCGVLESRRHFAFMAECTVGAFGPERPFGRMAFHALQVLVVRVEVETDDVVVEVLEAVALVACAAVRAELLHVVVLMMARAAVKLLVEGVERKPVLLCV